MNIEDIMLRDGRISNFLGNLASNRGAAMLIAVTLALEAAFARWIPPGSALDGTAQWAALLCCAWWVGGAVAGRRGWGIFWACLIFVLLVIVLSCGTIVIECTVRPMGCDL